jgi:hypothetical protein
LPKAGREALAFPEGWDQLVRADGEIHDSIDTEIRPVLDPREKIKTSDFVTENFHEVLISKLACREFAADNGGECLRSPTSW